MRNFASTLVKFSKLSHIQTTIWRPPKMAPPRTAGSAGPFVTPLVLSIAKVALFHNSVGALHNQQYIDAASISMRASATLFIYIYSRSPCCRGISD